MLLEIGSVEGLEDKDVAKLSDPKSFFILWPLTLPNLRLGMLTLRGKRETSDRPPRI